MKLNTKSLKRVSTDEKCTVLQHPDGHEIKIAHGALSKQMRSQLNKIPLQMAEGGEVNFVPPEEETSKAYPVEVVAQPEAPVEPSKEEKLFSYYKAHAGDSPFYAKKAAEMEAAKGATISPEVQQAAPSLEAGPAPASIAPPPMAAQPSAQPAMGLSPSASPQGAIGAIQNATNAYQVGANQEAAAIGEQGKQEAAIHLEQADAMANMAKMYEQNSNKLMSEYNSVMADYKAGHINPNHYMESMSSGQKVATAIGILLSGFSTGTPGQQSSVERFLDQQIDRDIKSQEANLGKQENLLKYNMQQFGNLRDATTMTMAMQKGLYAEKLEQAAALAKDPIAKARALQASAKFRGDAAKDIGELSTKVTTQGMLQSPNASPLQKIQALPKEMRDNALKELSDYKAIQTNLGQVDKVLDANFKASSLGENLASPIQSKKARDVAYAQLFPIVKSIVGEKMTDNDAKTLIGPYLAGFTTNEKTNDQLKRKLKEQLVAQARGRTPILSEYKIVPDLQGMVGADKNEKLLNWARANPKDPRAAQIMQKLGK